MNEMTNLNCLIVAPAACDHHLMVSRSILWRRIFVSGPCILEMGHSGKADEVHKSVVGLGDDLRMTNDLASVLVTWRRMLLEYGSSKILLLG